MHKSWLGALLATVAFTPVSSAETLQQAIDATLSSNPQLLIQEIQSGLADENLKQARSAGRTSLNLTGSAGLEAIDSSGLFSLSGERALTNAQLQATRPIYTGGRVRSGINQAEHGVEAALSDLDSVRQDLRLQVVTAYMDIIRDRETLRIRQNNLDVASEQFRAARDRFNVGVVTRTDVSVAEANVEGARASFAGAQAGLEASLANYKFLTGLQAGALSQPPVLPPLPQTVDEAIAIGLANNPLIVSARYSVEAADDAVKIAEAQRKPQISIVGTAGYQEGFGSEPLTRRDTNLSAIAQGTVPILSGGLLKSQIRSARLQRQQAAQQVTLLERQIQAQVAQSWFGYEAAKLSIEASKRQEQAAQIAYDGATEELGVGVRTTLDVLDQEQDLFVAKEAVVRAERDAYVAAHQLLRGIGQLDDSYLSVSTSVESVSTTPVNVPAHASVSPSTVTNTLNSTDVLNAASEIIGETSP